jgi:hypothetical protein
MPTWAAHRRRAATVPLHNAPGRYFGMREVTPVELMVDLRDTAESVGGGSKITWMLCINSCVFCPIFACTTSM